jgi:hypothetical protein
MRTFAEPDIPGSWDFALPLQAAVCDFAGIGRAVLQSATNAVVQVDQFWYGASTNGVINISNQDQYNFPTNGTPFVFFASAYPSFSDISPPECHYFYILNMDYHRSRYQPDGVYLYCGDRSWFPVTTSNTDLVNWCSNLVHVAQVNANMQSFYELIRDGYRLYPDASRIHRDSMYAFMHCSYFMTTNYMQSIWTDPLLVGRARDWVNMSYQQETKTWLP